MIADTDDYEVIARYSTTKKAEKAEIVERRNIIFANYHAARAIRKSMWQVNSQLKNIAKMKAKSLRQRSEREKQVIARYSNRDQS